MDLLSSVAYLSIYLSACLFVCLPIYLSSHLSSYLSKTKQVCKASSKKCFAQLQNEASLGDFVKKRTPQPQKDEILGDPSIFKFDNIKNEAILRDFLQKLKAECRTDGLVPMLFFHSICLKCCACHEKVRPSAAPVTQTHLSKPEDLIVENATLSRNQRLALTPNISDQEVSSIASATQNASLQIFFKHPTPATVCASAAKATGLAHFRPDAYPLRLPPKTRIQASKSRPKPSVFNTFDFEMCFMHFLNISTAKGAPLRILISKRVSRHSHVHFFNISAAKSAWKALCFVRFDFIKGLAPQPRVLSTTQLPRVLREWCLLYVLTSACDSRPNGVHFFDIPTSKSVPRLRCLTFTAASHHSAAQFLISHTTRWLCTRCFSEPTSHTLEKHSASRLFYLFAHLHLLSSDSFSSLSFFFPSAFLFSGSSHLFFSIYPYCRTFDF